MVAGRDGLAFVMVALAAALFEKKRAMTECVSCRCSKKKKLGGSPEGPPLLIREDIALCNVYIYISYVYYIMSYHIVIYHIVIYIYISNRAYLFTFSGARVGCVFKVSRHHRSYIFGIIAFIFCFVWGGGYRVLLPSIDFG